MRGTKKRDQDKHKLDLKIKLTGAVLIVRILESELHTFLFYFQKVLAFYLGFIFFL